MKKIPFDIVGFDLDGTLLDTSGDLAAAVNHTLAIIGRPRFSIEEVRLLVGNGAKVMLQRGLERSGGCTDELMAQYLPVLLQFYGENLAHHSKAYPGLTEAMDELHARGVRLAICTNKYERFAKALIEQMGLTERFDAIIGGDTMGPGKAKPHAAPIEEMIRRCGGGRTIFLGDSINDTMAAKSAGIPSIAVSFGFLNQPIEELGADLIIHHYEELIPTLEHWEVA
ncbi:HAD family hydrolase [Rhizorhapis suberifaciens]|uniref:Phosphoglycolate phosphatase n=1 Tax=Rhizorhapis suberifaciens TaxID=13656 RepID=A0A840HWS3_9SPHN|nr:HAD family hydrolase [Rhizorhapis suberifaciens]MBB4641916.1 phosphoglycolate phosphatase [Rhizorhapis suberifaciens]